MSSNMASMFWPEIAEVSKKEAETDVAYSVASAVGTLIQSAGLESGIVWYYFIHLSQ